jgi:hypothetical protein
MSDPTLSEYDETPGPLKSGFMNIDMAFQLLTRGIQDHDLIPSGLKDNAFMLLTIHSIRNHVNMEKEAYSFYN